MASSIDQLVNDLGVLFRKGAEDAMRSAKDQPDRFGRLLDDLAGTPEQLLDQLKQRLDPPDWLSLMILIALQLKKIVGDALEVDVWTPAPDWAKALRLTYTQQGGGGVGRLRLAIALGGGEADINGLAIVVENSVQLAAGGQLVLKADSSGNVTFLIPFGSAMQKDGNGKVAVSLALDTPKFVPASLSDAGLDLTVGRPTIGGELDGTIGGAINWKTFARLGNTSPPEEPGLAAKADFTRLLGDLAAMIHIEALEQSYKPALIVANGTPQFDLNQRTGP
jgi:hypothetical protein